MTTTNTILTPGGAADVVGVDFETTKEIGYYRLVWLRFCSRKVALVGAVVLLVLALACYVGPFLLPAQTVDLNVTDLAPFTSIHHILGTDDTGRDLLIRNLLGGRISLLVGASAMLLTITIATVLGALSGFFGGIVDSVVTAATNAVLSIPSILILVIFAKAFGQSILTIVLGIALIGWPPTARIVRSVILSVREKEFVEAARSARSWSRRRSPSEPPSCSSPRSPSSAWASTRPRRPGGACSTRGATSSPTRAGSSTPSGPAS